jgi:hypothetical protein
MQSLPRAETAAASWRDFGAVILVRRFDAALPLVNRIAAEHLELAIDDAEGLLREYAMPVPSFSAATRRKSSATMSAAPTTCCRRHARHASPRA